MFKQGERDHCTFFSKKKRYSTLFYICGIVLIEQKSFSVQAKSIQRQVTDHTWNKRSNFDDLMECSHLSRKVPVAFFKKLNGQWYVLMDIKWRWDREKWR